MQTALSEMIDVIAHREKSAAPLRVLWTIDGVSGGGGAVLAHLVHGLRHWTHQVAVNSDIPQLSQGMKRYVRAAGAEIHSSGFATEPRELRRIAASMQPQLVVAHWWNLSHAAEATLALRPHLPARTRFVLIIHNQGLPPPGFDLYVAVSHFSKNSLVQRSQGRIKPIRVIHNGIDLGRFAIAQPERHSEFRTGRIGGFGPYKVPPNYADMIGGIRLPHHVHHMAGDGGYLDAFRRTVAEKKLEAKFVFWGELEFQSERLVEFYRTIDAYFFIPAVIEPFPMVVIEAMASGRPIVAHDNGGVREQVEHGENGFLCENIRDFYRAVARLARDRPLRQRMGEASRSRAKLFSRETMAAKYASLFRTLLAQT